MPAPTPYNLWDIPRQFNPQDLVPSDCTCVVGQVMPSPDLEIELLSDSVHNLTCMPIEWICLQFEEKDIFSLKILTKFRGQEDILHKSHETKPNEMWCRAKQIHKMVHFTRLAVSYLWWRDDSWHLDHPNHLSLATLILVHHQMAAIIIQLLWVAMDLTRNSLKMMRWISIFAPLNHPSSPLKNA